MVAGAVEHVVHPVAQHLSPQVSDDALADDREMAGIVEDPPDGGRVPDQPADTRKPPDRPREPTQSQQYRECRPAGRQQPPFMTAGFAAAGFAAAGFVAVGFVADLVERHGVMVALSMAQKPREPTLSGPRQPTLRADRESRP
jgi:hypothetical protein